MRDSGIKGLELVHYISRGGGTAWCGSDVKHNGERYSTYEGDATCLPCLRNLADGMWPGAADVIRDGLYADA